MSTLDELGAFLVNNGFGVLAQEIWLGRRPDTPDNIITLTEYPGLTPTYIQGSVGTENPNIQVSVRGKSYDETRSRAQLVWNLFASFANTVLGTTMYQRISCHASPALIGHDSQDRILIGFNIAVMKEVPG